MKTIDEIAADKLLELINYLLSKIIKPDIKIDSISKLTENDIDELKNKFNVEAIILDVDDTLRKELKMIPKCNQEWIENLKCKIIVLSNGKDQKIKDYFEKIGIDYIEFAHKPLRKNFVKACEKLNVDPKNVLVIGDSLFSDIYGGKRNNMKTMLVKNVEDEER